METLWKVNKKWLYLFPGRFSFAQLVKLALRRNDLIKANNDQLMASFEKLLKNTAGQIKRANENERYKETEISRTAQV